MNQFNDKQRRSPLAQFFYILFYKMLPIILLNGLFIITSIPLLTIPQSIASMNKSMQHLLLGGEEPVYRIYFKTFKKDFLPTFITGALTIFILTGLAYGAYFYYLNATRFIYLFFTFLLLTLFVIIYSISVYVYQMLVSVKLPLRVIYKNAAILAFTQPKQTLFGGLGSLAVITLSIFYFPYSTPFLILVSFSLSAYIATFATYSVIKTKIIK